MADILHRIGIRTGSVDKVYQALSTIEGLSGWWTNDTTGEAGEVGGEIQFRFTGGGFDMTVTRLEAPSLVEWQVLAGNDDWNGTYLRFELRKDGDFVIVLFKHIGWREPVEFMHHCSTKWAIFLMSLKSLIETGTGAPNPVDQKIDNWN